ncbi:Uncharacterized conserved protein [Plasmopara halstedii]|uniref:Ubiquitin-like-conjugating enzyme ATG10 n=1 Tax=Plasmopara halstedii TaxID=4781 RepID=A0A0P1AGB8_PLAHL|nr:Uncharacterized conserved protein [Plasmopara halstedii]CEG39676.1 Uncharacterized conserved protein [Plasmopara halstedii]|eukprot:XP_024576045.1 Uncharacterized conserved protein [Plasmopara halstedii]
MRRGSLSYRRFCLEAELLRLRSHEVARMQTVGKDECVATWEWRHGRRQHLEGDSYLVSTGNVRQDYIAKSFDGMMDIDKLDSGDIDKLLQSEDVDDVQTTVVHCQGDKIPLFEFHILYHTIFQTPVLYFRAHSIDGTPLNLDAFTQSVHLPGFIDLSRLVAMEGHPILGEPFTFLHPCETAAVMQLLQAQPKFKFGCIGKDSLVQNVPHYLASWLSLVQPLTGISPMDYYSI